MTQPGSYTFVPWFRQGAAAGIEQTDDPTAPRTGRASVAAELVLAYTPAPGAPAGAAPAIARSVELVGPGDVRGIKPDAVLRVHPQPDARDATPGELAYVEFYDEDLPWRYTPASAATVTVAGQQVPRLRPWLALLVLHDGEFTVAPRADSTPVVTVAGTAPLPPPAEAWAWAHAQLAGLADAANAGAQVRADPNAALSRLLSPRKLEAGRTYTAFLVPAFETGRRAGLGMDIATIPAQRPSWDPAQTDRRFPVYHMWRFATSTDGSFESYVRRLTAHPVDESFGKRPLDLSTIGSGLDAVAGSGPVEIEGALRPPDFPRDDFPSVPGAPLVAALEQLVDAGAERLMPGADVPPDPGIVPPAYGRWHAAVTLLADADPGDWVRELNLDPRARAAAGLGAQAVRERQDDLMERAWNQVGRLRDANQRLREAELAMAASEALFGKHLDPADGEPADQERLMLLTAAAHRGLPAPTHDQVPGSVRALVQRSALPTATGDAAFKRATRPARRLLREATGSTNLTGFQDGALLERLNDATVTAAPPVAAPVGAVSLATVTTTVAAAGTAMAPKLLEPKRVFWELLVGALTAAQQPDAPLVLPGVPKLQSDTTTALTAWLTAHPQEAAVHAKVTTLIAAIDSVLPDGPRAAIVVITAAAFDNAFGTEIAGKGGDGVTVMRKGAAAGGKLARFADASGAADYLTEVIGVDTELQARFDRVPPAPQPVAALPAVAGGVRDALRPSEALFTRVAAALPGFAAALDQTAQVRARRLQPVLAYPEFRDAAVEALQRLDRGHVLPNIGALPPDTITLMEPNRRFIEAFLAGLNTEMARELLWREYPTDQRGSYFRVFWDRADALTATDPADVRPLHEWSGALGGNGVSGSSPIVLVIRSELLRKFPNTVVYAQAAAFTTGGRRTLDLNASPVHPAFHASLEPDVSLIGFELDEERARGRAPTATDPGDPGMFFVLAERPGQPRFGLDLTAPSGGLRTWDDLSWSQLAGAPDHIEVAANAFTPSDPSPGTWPATSADLAAILFRSPVMYARHAGDMLP